MEFSNILLYTLIQHEWFSNNGFILIYKTKLIIIYVNHTLLLQI